jgi:hypothetical protein
VIRGTIVSGSLRVGTEISGIPGLTLLGLRRDASGRAEAQAHALGLGVPAAQIDWPE